MFYIHCSYAQGIRVSVIEFAGTEFFSLQAIHFNVRVTFLVCIGYFMMYALGSFSQKRSHINFYKTSPTYRPV